MEPEQAVPASPQLPAMRPAGTAPPVRPRLAASVWTACLVVAAAGAAWGGYIWVTHDRTPSCSWPLRVRGAATAQQAGLVRCYLQALARRDIAGLYAVADNIPKVRITPADLKYSADARTGLATACFSPSSVSTSYAGLTITYADGAIETTGILNMVAMGGPSTWRMTIGS
jgi:hypothetical protein